MILPSPIIEPPDRYMQQEQPSVIINYPPATVESVCRRWGRGELSCAFINGIGRCVIVIPTAHDWEGAPWTYPVAIRHEQANCNGWPAAHPK